MAGLADDLEGLQAQVATLTLEDDSLRAELSEAPADAMDQVTDQAVSVLNQAQGGVGDGANGWKHPSPHGHSRGFPEAGSVRPPSVEALGRKEVNDDEDQSPQRGGSGTGWRA